MLSASTNTHHPAFSWRGNDRYLTSRVDQEERLESNHVRLRSFQEPPLTVGSYTLSVSQSLKVDANDTNPSLIPLPDRRLEVKGPKFRLLDAADIHSVYPAPGQSDYCQTLAHVVFRHPTTPWERKMDNSIIGANRMPWLAVLSFTEDELILNPQTCKDAGFETVSPHGTMPTKAGDAEASTSFISPIHGQEEGKRDYDLTDDVDLLLVKQQLFKQLFATDSSETKPHWNGAADLTRFSYMAHVREMHGGFMASTDAANVQPQFSVVLSPRTGPPGITQPARIISHLISLEGLSSMDLEKQGSDYVGLVSLFSWDWMCIPPNQVDFTDIMRALGTNVQPLRVSDLDLAEFQKDNSEMDAVTTAWLFNTLNAGFTLKPHVLRNGRQTTSLVRGPLIPVDSAREMIEPFTMYWSALELHDSVTEISDVSYSAAWSLGRSLAMTDTTFAPSLLRLRSKSHASAVKVAQSKALGDDRIDAAAYMSTLWSSIEKVSSAHSIDGLAKQGATPRWLRKRKERERVPALQLSTANYSYESYKEELSNVLYSCLGLSLKGSNSMSSSPDADGLVLQAWALDKYYLAGLPLHYLIPDPDMLPRESIRTFCVDQKWVDAVIDGGLSLGNHHARKDDAFRREIKKYLNDFLGKVRDDGPGKGTTLQIPKWGFLLRSIAVSAFPDLKVEARLRDGTPEGLREVLYMQLLADDILICLFDRRPGEDHFDQITISQPQHQQSFEVGNVLGLASLRGVLRPIPLVTGTPLPPIGMVEEAPSGDPSDGMGIYDWGTRLLRPSEYLKRYIDAMEKYPDKDQVFQWVSKDQAPASMLASQLSRPILCLTLRVQKQQSGPVNGESGHQEINEPPWWERPGAQVCVKEENIGEERPFRTNQTESDDNQRPDPGYAELPMGPLTPFDPKPSLSKPWNPAPEKIMDFVENLGAQSAISQAKHLETACFPLYDPGNTRGIIYALDRPIDLVFSLKYPQDGSTVNTYPRKLEVRIPVSLDTDGYGSSPSMLRLPGTLAAPILPKVESLNPSGLFSYGVRLVVGNLYDQQGQTPPDSTVLNPLPEQDLLLIVAMTPRFASDKMPLSGFNGSFLLCRVQAELPETAQGSQNAQFDICTYDGAEAAAAEPTSIQCKPVTIQRATTVSLIGSPSYDVDTQQVSFTVKYSNPLSDSQAAVIRIKGPLGDALEPILLPLGDPVDGDCHRYSAFVDRNNAPKRLRLGIVSKNTLERIGPETDLLVIPILPPRIDLGLYWRGDGLLMSWETAPTAGRLNFDFHFRAMTSQGALEESTSVTANTTRKEALLPREWLYESGLMSCHPLRIHQQMSLVGDSKIHGVVWEQSKSFEQIDILLCQNQRQVSDIQVHHRSSLVWVPGSNGEILDLLFVGSNQVVSGIHLASDSSSNTGDALVQGAPPALASGALVSFDVNSDELHASWIGDDGRLETISRDFKDSQYFSRITDEDMNFHQLNVASIVGGGSIVAAACTWIHKDFPYILIYDSLMWWVSDKGTVSGARWVAISIPGLGTLPWLQGKMLDTYKGKWQSRCNLEEQVAKTDTRVSEMTSWWVPTEGTVLDRPNQRLNRLLWISPSGALRLVEVWTSGIPFVDPLGEFSYTDAVPDANASPESGLCACPCDGLQLAFWVSRSGGVWGAYEDLDKKWIRFSVAPSGSAHSATRLRMVTRFKNAPVEMTLFWFDPNGRLQTATRRQREAPTVMFPWSLSVFTPFVDTPVDGNVDLVVADWPKMGRQTLFWVGLDNRLQCLEFEW